MGAKKISQLSELTGITLDDVIVIVHSGTTYQTTINELAQIFPINKITNENGINRIPMLSGNTTLVDSLIYQTSGTTTIQNYLILSNVINLNYIDDTAAGNADISIGGIYHTDGVLKIRLPDPGGR